jgi:dTDP-4-dehydrorhamnose 3,5-epimerase-like enzyme
MKTLLLKKASVFHRDDRGWTIDPFIKEDFPKGSPENIHLVSVAPGGIRANHYHTRQTEYLCMIGSKALVVVEELATNKREEEVVDCAEPTILRVFPNFAHAIKNIGSEMMYILCSSNMPYNPDKRDVVQKIIIK